MAFMNGSALPGTISAIEGAAAPTPTVHTTLAVVPMAAARSGIPHRDFTSHGNAAWMIALMEADPVRAFASTR
jgi:hypothetical protein